MRSFEQKLKTVKMTVVVALVGVSRLSVASAADLREFQVLPGDSIKSISYILYGTEDRWQEIIQANQKKIPNPNYVWAGEFIKTPADWKFEEKIGRARLAKKMRGENPDDVMVAEVTPPAPAPVVEEKEPEPTPQEKAQAEAERKIASIVDPALVAEAQEREENKAKEKVSKTTFNEAHEEFKRGNYESAAQNYRKSREINPNDLATWFYEIKSLQGNHKDQEAREVAKELLSVRPDLKELPFLKKLVASSD